MLRGAWRFAVAALQATRAPSGSRCATSASRTPPAAAPVFSRFRACWQVGSSSRCQPRQAGHRLCWGRPLSCCCMGAAPRFSFPPSTVPTCSTQTSACPGASARGLRLATQWRRCAQRKRLHGAVKARPLHISQHARLIGEWKRRNYPVERWPPTPSYQTLFSHDGSGALCRTRSSAQSVTGPSSEDTLGCFRMWEAAPGSASSCARAARTSTTG